ncbi:MAG: Gfo/Idh/MocA family oxidoreductase [Chloroflexi bacterium]|nr:Gfo/Idh/MocA family oxidoreductase [Chloroflexota bacterium]
MDPLRVAVIGAGNFGQHHVRIFSEMSQVDLVGVVETCEERGKFLAEKYGTRHYTDYNDLLGEVDAVNIAVPTSFHYRIAMDFLLSGTHVLVEKPITDKLEEAKELVDIAREKDLVLQVGHLERFNPAVRQLKLMLKKPSFIEAHRLSYPVRRNLDVGVVWDLMIHDIDILIDLMGSPVTNINSLGLSVYSEKEDLALVQVMAENGCLANLVASRISGIRSRKLVVQEDEHTYSLDLINQTLAIMRPPRGDHTNPPEYVPIKKDEPLRLELLNFIDCITTHRSPVVSGEDGKMALDLALQIVNCMKIVNGSQEMSKKLLASAR